jgi:putative FmdB family regulatory protein
MPTYVYECAKCGEELEAWQSFSDEPLKKHPACGGKLVKVMQPVGIVFKGSGFHRTDSRNGAKRSKVDSSSESNDSTSEKSEQSAGTSSTDAKAGGKADSSSGNGAKKSSDAKSSSSSKESPAASATPK